MGLEGTAAGFDASTLYVNPAQAAFALHPELQIAAPYTQTQVQYAFPKDTNVAEFTTKQVSPQLYLLLKKKSESPLTFGIAYNSPFRISTDWGDTWRGKLLVTSFQLQAHNIQPTLAFRLKEKLGIGIGLMLMPARFHYERLALSSGPVDNAKYDLEAKGMGVGINAGLSYRLSNKWHWGLSYRSQTKLHFQKGELVFTDPAQTDSSKQLIRDTFSTALRLPQQISLGTAYRLSARTLLSAELGFVNWTVWDSLQINSQTITLKNKQILAQNQWSLRVGFSQQLLSFLSLRTGVYYTSTMAREDYVLPHFPDAARIGLAAGLHFKAGKHLYADLSARKAWTGYRTSLDILSRFQAVYKIDYFALGLAVGTTF